jgi:hypothetical protein
MLFHSSLSTYDINILRNDLSCGLRGRDEDEAKRGATAVLHVHYSALTRRLFFFFHFRRFSWQFSRARDGVMSRDNHPPMPWFPSSPPTMEGWLAGLLLLLLLALVLALDALPALVIIKESLPPPPSIAHLLLCFFASSHLRITARGTRGSGLSLSHLVFVPNGTHHPDRNC